MSHLRPLLAFAAAAVIGGLVACGSPAPKCSPASCSGCCDASGQCVNGANQNQCGAAGNVCTSCSAGTVCEFGICRAQSAGGGTGGGATGGGTGGGATGGGTGGGTTGGGTGGGTTGGGTGGGTTGGGTGGGATGGGTGGGTTGGGTGGGSTGGGTGGGTTGGGTGGGTMGTGGGGGSTMFDAGTTLSDGGTYNPPTIQLTFAANCGAVNLCSGNEQGDWFYSSGCIDDSNFTRITNVASTFGCSSTVSNKRGSIAGTVIFTGSGTNVRRNAVGQVQFHLSLTGTLCVANCSSVSSYFPMGVTGSCAQGTGTCECDLAFDIGYSGSEPYTYTGGQLTTTQSMETYDTCITEPTLRYRETTDGGTAGVFGVTRVGAAP